MSVVKGVSVIRLDKDIATCDLCGEHHEVYDINELIQEAIEYEKIGKEDVILEAKFRLRARDSVPKQMIDEMVEKLGDLTVVEVDLRSYKTVSAESERRDVEIAEGITVELEFDHTITWYLYELRSNFKGKTFREMMTLMNSFSLPFNVFDQVTELVLENGEGLRIRLGCQSDCQMTLHYASEDWVYEWFGTLCYENQVRIEVGLCAQKEVPEETYKTCRTGKKTQTGWVCV